MPDQLAANQVALVLGTQLRNLKETTFQALTLEWLDMEFHNKADIDGWLTTVMPIIDNSYEVAIEATSIFADIQIGLLLDDPDYQGPPIDPELIRKQLRGGVPPPEVYQRPFVDFWKSLKDGNSLNDALHSGSNRLGELIDTDLERLSDLTSVEKYANENKIVGYRRVLVGPKNCALCVVASTQRYRRRVLKPIHPHCNCKVSPVLSFESDGASQVIDEDLLNQIHDSIAKKFGISSRDARKIDYRKIMVERLHGEIGPYLSWRGQKFTGPSDLL